MSIRGGKGNTASPTFGAEQRGSGNAAAAIEDIEDWETQDTETSYSKAVGPPSDVREGKVVLLTGAAGFIGSHVGKILLERGDKVVVIDEVNDYYSTEVKEQNLELLRDHADGGKFFFERGDLAEEAFVEGVYKRHNITHIIHLAARAGVRPSIQDPNIYIHSNVDATTKLLQIAVRNGCEHFVFASSSSVYGGSRAAFFSEKDVINHPVSPYAATKAACELLGYTWNHLYGLHVAGLRFFTVYGPRGRPDMAPFKFIDRVMKGEPLQQYGDGSSSRDYTYVADIADGVVRALDRPNGFQIYNLGNGSPILLRDFIRTIGEITGKKPQIEKLPPQPGDVPRTCANISKAKVMLGYRPQTALHQGIEKTLAWYKDFYGVR